MEVTSVKKSFYLPYLDGLRASAALFVVLHHIMLQFNFKGLHISFLEYTTTILPFMYGHYAVNFFIVLSGFSLTIPMVNNNNYSLKDGSMIFFLKRVRRIYMPYFFSLIFSFLLINSVIGEKTGTHWDACIPVTKADIVTHILLIHDVFSSTFFKINHAFWSISVEFRIYLFFPVMLWLRRRFGALANLLFSITISMIIFLVTDVVNTKFQLGLDRNHDGVNPFIILFALGMLAAEISLSKDMKVDLTKSYLKAHWPIIAVVCFVILLFVIKFIAGKGWEYHFEMDDVLFGCLAFFFLVAVAGNKFDWLKKIFSFKPLVFIGTFSYSIYLIHAPLIQIIWQYIITPLHINELQGYWTLIAFGLPIILLISYLFYLLFELPFLNSSKKNLKQVTIDLA